MPRITYNKLIRDSIPEIIEQDGKVYEVEVMPEAEYRQALLEKLVEEAQEAKEASARTPKELNKELADLFEVIDAVIAAHKLDEAEIRQLQRHRHVERGGFAKRLKLLWVNEV